VICTSLGDGLRVIHPPTSLRAALSELAQGLGLRPIWPEGCGTLSDIPTALGMRSTLAARRGDVLPLSALRSLGSVHTIQAAQLENGTLLALRGFKRLHGRAPARHSGRCARAGSEGAEAKEYQSQYSRPRQRRPEVRQGRASPKGTPLDTFGGVNTTQGGGRRGQIARDGRGGARSSRGRVTNPRGDDAVGSGLRSGAIPLPRRKHRHPGQRPLRNATSPKGSRSSLELSRCCASPQQA